MPSTLPAECNARSRWFGEQDFRAPAPLCKDGEQDFVAAVADAAAAAEVRSLLDGELPQSSLRAHIQ